MGTPTNTNLSGANMGKISTHVNSAEGQDFVNTENKNLVAGNVGDLNSVITGKSNIIVRFVGDLKSVNTGK